MCRIYIIVFDTPAMKYILSSKVFHANQLFHHFAVTPEYSQWENNHDKHDRNANYPPIVTSIDQSGNKICDV